jgi:N-acetyl-anhydromuramyl-L-alanine amidase AmpD
VEQRVLTTGDPKFGTLSVEVGWQPTPNWSVRKAETRLIVLHSAECRECGDAAEALAIWGGGPDRPRASWHFAADNNSITQSVELDCAAWHAGCVNHYSVGIEQAGTARQTREQWFDPYSLAMLHNVARLVALLCDKLTIPVAYIEADELADWHKREGGAWGITTHAQVSEAFKVRGGHWDPGPAYPIDWLLQRVDDILAEVGLKH